jgi:hypothetical protein
MATRRGRTLVGAVFTVVGGLALSFLLMASLFVGCFAVVFCDAPNMTSADCFRMAFLGVFKYLAPYAVPTGLGGVLLGWLLLRSAPAPPPRPRRP